MDYIPLSSSLTFNASSDMECVDVMIVDDTVVEGEESFTVSLTTSDPDVMVENGTVVVVVIMEDPDDGKDL